MPVLQYKCNFCKKEFEELVKNHTDEVRCPDCGNPAVRQWCGKMFSSTGKPAKHCSGNCSSCGGCG